MTQTIIRDLDQTSAGPAEVLHKYFGHKTFRPLQEEIVSSVLSGHDNFVLMPTGGGKSICYQLPALLLPGLTIVVSPLIALMKDQVDALQANGVAATFINSSLDGSEVDDRKRAIREGKIKLLYAAPERLLMPNFLEFLAKIEVSLFAIDEAHCISMWGHDFRDEYRGLSLLRKKFPAVPIIAMTATATSQVAEDIVHQLSFKPEAKQWLASFDRPNLFYSVKQKQGGLDQVIDFIEARKDQSGIIYCFSRNQAEQMATALTKTGHTALPYHAGLDRALRTRNQDKFIKGEVNIVCATIAFGMGIDKPDIRYVVHYDLPKSISGYYQETGRAGRDGLNSECVLMYSLSDKVKQMHFVNEKETQQERARALEELDEIVSYAELATCRRGFLLKHFGESYWTDNCGACDNCTSTRKTERIDATKIAQMFLSCVVRAKEKFGANHIIDILRGSESQKVLDFRHQTLSTYGVGKEISKADWSHYAKELLREGYARQDHMQHSVIRVTKKGWDVLKNTAEVRLLAPQREKEVEKVHKTGAFIELPPTNKQLLKVLKELRSEIATYESVAPHNVFDEPSLYHMSLELPVTLKDMLMVEGIPERKAKRYGNEFVAKIKEFLRAHPEAQRFNRVKKLSSQELSLHYYLSGSSPLEISKERELAESTVFGHLIPYVVSGEIKDITRLVPEERWPALREAFTKYGTNLTDVIELSGGQFSYNELRIMRAYDSRAALMAQEPHPTSH